MVADRRRKTRFLCAIAPAVPSSSIASSTLGRLCAGSPIPMKTTLPTLRRLRPAHHLGDDLGAAELTQQAVRDRSCRTGSRPRNRPASIRRGQSAAAARSRPPARRPTRPRGAPNRRRRGVRNALAPVPRARRRSPAVRHARRAAESPRHAGGACRCRATAPAARRAAGVVHDRVWRRTRAGAGGWLRFSWEANASTPPRYRPG